MGPSPMANRRILLPASPSVKGSHSSSTANFLCCFAQTMDKETSNLSIGLFDRDLLDAAMEEGGTVVELFGRGHERMPLQS